MESPNKEENQEINSKILRLSLSCGGSILEVEGKNLSPKVVQKNFDTLSKKYIDIPKDKIKFIDRLTS